MVVLKFFFFSKSQQKTITYRLPIICHASLTPFQLSLVYGPVTIADMPCNYADVKTIKPSSAGNRL